MSLTIEQQDCRNVLIYFEVFLKKLKRGYIPAGTSTQTGRNGINVNGTRNAVTIPGSTPGRTGVTTY